MRFRYFLFVLLHVADSYPVQIDCASDAATRLQLGSKIMYVEVTKAPSVKMTALRKDESISAYIPGELLSLQISGLASGSLAVVRASSKSNTTLSSDDGMFEAKCAGQMYTPEDKKLAGSAKLFFRPGCNTSSEGLTLSVVSSVNMGSPVYLSELTLHAEEGKVDSSCSGGSVPTPPPPGQQDPLYVRLIWVHRVSVLLSWGVLFPLGIALVRHYPSGWRLRNHRIIQVMGLVVECIDFACIVCAHHVGPDGMGPVDPDFSGTAGASPSSTHKQRGLAVFICIVLQLVLGVARPKPYPNDFSRRVWLWAHRTIGDGAMVIAWIQIWEATSLLADHDTFMAMTIFAGLVMFSSLVVLPIYCMMLAGKKVEDDLLGQSLVQSAAVQEEAHPRDAYFFGCGYCTQVFTSSSILDVHIRMTHNGAPYSEVLSPMTQRFAEITDMPAVSAGVPLSEVMKHRSKSDCWVVINGFVYDVTNFLHAHPGGPNPVISYAGRDATKAWNLIHQEAWLTDSSITKNLVERLGPLAPEPPVEGMPSSCPQEDLHWRGRASANGVSLSEKTKV